MDLSEGTRLPGQFRSVRAARSFVAGVLGDSHPHLDDALLLTSEAVTNAVLHSDSGERDGTVGEVVVRVEEHNDLLHIEVCDEGSVTTPHTCPNGGRLGIHGRGIRILESVSDRWGFTREEGGGTNVWFEFGEA